MIEHVVRAAPDTPAATKPAGRIPLPTAGGCALVIFGGTGDLTRRKLMPALWRLQRHRCFDDCFSILGVGREELGDEGFRDAMRAALQEFSDDPPSDEEWNAFADRLLYLAADLTADDAYRRVFERLSDMAENESSLGNHLFYLAVPPSLAPRIVQGLESAGLTGEEGGWTRIVVEKPFGRDLESAHALNEVIGDVFDERQVYRIDHFLGKETVQNILAFRFGNMLFEPIWNRNYIEYVEISAAETLGV